ncbi:MAG: sugar phosphate isomerase/epimerase family protein [Planctomycetota bacterium]
MPDLIAIDAGPAASVKIASRAGFTGLDLRINRFADEIERVGVESLAEAIAAAGLRPGYCSLTPQKINVRPSVWNEELLDLPRRARIAAELGFARATSVVLPFHDEMAFDDNMAMHRSRVNAAAEILSDHGISFGLEYVSPLSRRRGQPNGFVHDLNGLLELLDGINADNTGVMLDCFHWHCAGESADDLRRLRPEQIIAVHVNDLIAGVPVDEQAVTERELPGQTGIIDIATFLRTLDGIGYEGPITSEPTHARWKSVEDEPAAAQTCNAIVACLARAGIGGAEPTHQPRSDAAGSTA